MGADKLAKIAQRPKNLSAQAQKFVILIKKPSFDVRSPWPQMKSKRPASPIQLIIDLFMLIAGNHHGIDTKRKLMTYFNEKDTELQTFKF